MLCAWHDQVCIPHRPWIGRAVEAPASQFDLADLPEIVAARKRHYRLLRRYGPDVINAGYEQNSRFWTPLLQHGYRISDLTQRLARLQPRAARTVRTVRPWDPKRCRILPAAPQREFPPHHRQAVVHPSTPHDRAHHRGSDGPRRSSKPSTGTRLRRE
jgi:hypothetical protein